MIVWTIFDRWKISDSVMKKYPSVFSMWMIFFMLKFQGVAREVVKHPDVKIVHQVEIDGRVVELSKKYLPSMAYGFDSPKLKLTIGDGFEFMKQHEGEFDVIIITRF